MFSPHHPNGDYVLKLWIYEEKIVAKMLCELARSEGWAFMQNIKLSGQKIDKMSNDVIRQITDSGIFECTYMCPAEKLKLDAREKLG
jgi:hypothetical protein